LWRSRHRTPKADDDDGEEEESELIDCMGNLMELARAEWRFDEDMLMRTPKWRKQHALLKLSVDLGLLESVDESLEEIQRLNNARERKRREGRKRFGRAWSKAVWTLHHNGEDWDKILDNHLATALQQRRADVAQLLIDRGAEFDDRTLEISFGRGVELATLAIDNAFDGFLSTRTDVLAKVIRLPNDGDDDEDDDGEIDYYEDDDAFAIAKLLVDFGAQVDPQTAIAEHASPLERAVQYGWKEMVRWLLKRGAKPVLRASILHRRNKRLISGAARGRCKAIAIEEFCGHVVDDDLEYSLNSDGSSDAEEEEEAEEGEAQ
jgi:hypothetical protein